MLKRIAVSRWRCPCAACGAGVGAVLLHGSPGRSEGRPPRDVRRDAVTASPTTPTPSSGRSTGRRRRSARASSSCPQGRYRLTRTINVWPAIRLIGYGAKRPVFVLGAEHARLPGQERGELHGVLRRQPARARWAAAERRRLRVRGAQAGRGPAPPAGAAPAGAQAGRAGGRGGRRAAVRPTPAPGPSTRR